MCDHTGRTTIAPGDAYLGLVECGTDMHMFAEFLKWTRDNAHAQFAPITCTKNAILLFYFTARKLQ